MLEEYLLVENLNARGSANGSNIFKSSISTHDYNIYLINNRLYFVFLENLSKRLSSLNRSLHTWSSIFGTKFGLLGVFTIALPAQLVYEPKIASEMKSILNKLRLMPTDSITELKSYNCDVKDVIFQQRQKTVRIYLGEDWVYVDQKTADTIKEAVFKKNTLQPKRAN